MRNIIKQLPSFTPAIYGLIVGGLQLGRGGLDRTILVTMSVAASIGILVITLVLGKIEKRVNQQPIYLIIQLLLSGIAILFLYNWIPPVKY